ncbi:glycosyltransferase family 4 protein [Cryobacterium luteum]|uniref:D-inositol 3-phosphate glycosyltransferase n=1 Tax=Cryobacterium luteum TaxID=1424661 RepID=A0A1H8KQ18_9MICO|nr:glycosyltransferase family 4 protein [Cryobacterium luteum]TFB95049.1 glycosyltransferase [Cryobacterium luteum]SEN94967.1 Glycosyltransferase involved in cell wall bisynthesis [Cryobacterium luteum]
MAEPRVAIAYDCFFPINSGGGERVYRRIAELLTERGSPVDYVTRSQWDGPAPEARFSVVPVWHGAIYNSEGTRTPVSAVKFALALFRHFRAQRANYDVVIVSALPVLNVFAVQLALAGSKTFVVSDWLEVWGWRQWRAYSGALMGTVASLLQFVAIRLGNLHTVNSHFTGSRIRGYRRGAAPVTLGLIDLVGAAPDVTTKRGEEPYLIFVGRHIADKQLIDLLPALREARTHIHNLRLVIVGSGPETVAVAARSTELGLDDVVTLAGRVSDDELHTLLAGARALVNPSRREGFGLVVAEAAAVATPSVVVAGPDNAAAELVHNGVNGFVASSVRPRDLAEAMVKVVTAGEPLRRSTQAWFEQERTAGGLSRSIDQILQAYRSARTS